MVYGTSSFVDEQAKAQATAEFYDYAPQPCVCCGCLVPEAQKKRTFMNSYDNKMMMNKVFAPCVCFCDDEMCMSDMVQTAFYDKPPFRVGMCCFCIPCTCCGPPVMFSHNPKCLCIDTAPCFGSVVKIAPCNLYGLKCCLCFGNPCYVNCSIPIMGGLKGPDAFLSKTKQLVGSYHEAKAIPEAERVIFESVSDNVGDFGGVNSVEMKRG